MILTIIIPFKDAFNYLHECIESIPDEKDLEVILVDDNSIGQFKLKKTFAHTIFRILKLPKTARNAGSARNFGIKHARGDYLFFLDSDDKLHSRNFTLMLQRLRACSVDIVVCKATSFYNDGSQAKRHIYYNKLIDRYLSVQDKYLLCKFYSPTCKFIKTKLVRENEIWFDETFVSNDVMFSASIGVAHKSCEILNQIGYAIRSHQEGLSKTWSKNEVRTRFEVQCRFNSLMRKINRSDLCASPMVLMYNALKLSPFLFVKLVYLTLKDRIVSK